MMQFPPEALEPLRLPALIVAVPAGVALFAKTVVWVRAVMTPLPAGAPAANGTGEWRGRVEQLLSTAQDDQRELTRIVAKIDGSQAEIARVMADMAGVLREHNEHSGIAVDQVGEIHQMVSDLHRRRGGAGP